MTGHTMGLIGRDPVPDSEFDDVYMSPRPASSAVGDPVSVVPQRDRMPVGFWGALAAAGLALLPVALWVAGMLADWIGGAS